MCISIYHDGLSDQRYIQHTKQTNKQQHLINIQFEVSFKQLSSLLSVINIIKQAQVNCIIYSNNRIDKNTGIPHLTSVFVLCFTTNPYLVWCFMFYHQPLPRVVFSLSFGNLSQWRLYYHFPKKSKILYNEMFVILLWDPNQMVFREKLTVIGLCILYERG